MNLYITSAKYIEPLSVKVFFSDGSNKTVDVGCFIKQHPHPQYNRYLDKNKFKTFKIECGNIVWGKNWDLIFPAEDLHEGRLSE